MSDLSDPAEHVTLRGLALLNLWVDDLDAGIDWYSGVLGRPPYFVRQPGYAEFRLGDHDDELGLVSTAFSPRPQPTTPGGAIVFWHVDDVRATVDHLLTRGASTYWPVTERGEGFVPAAVLDPFGNVLGVMQSPNWRAHAGT